MERDAVMNLSSIRDRIHWDVDLNREFINRRTGFTFVIDVYDGVSHLALYSMWRNYSETDILPQQPPHALLDQTVNDQGGDFTRGGLYHIDRGVRTWIEENLLK